MGTPPIAAVTLESSSKVPIRLSEWSPSRIGPPAAGKKVFRLSGAQICRAPWHPGPCRRKDSHRGISWLRCGIGSRTLSSSSPMAGYCPRRFLNSLPRDVSTFIIPCLPKYRGAAPAAWTIINGEKEAGVTTMQLVEKMDAGGIYLQRRSISGADETTGSLQVQAHADRCRLLLETLRRLKDRIPRATRARRKPRDLGAHLKERGWPDRLGTPGDRNRAACSRTRSLAGSFHPFRAASC